MGIRTRSSKKARCWGPRVRGSDQRERSVLFLGGRRRVNLDVAVCIFRVIFRRQDFVFCCSAVLFPSNRCIGVRVGKSETPSDFTPICGCCAVNRVHVCVINCDPLTNWKHLSSVLMYSDADSVVKTRSCTKLLVLRRKLAFRIRSPCAHNHGTDVNACPVTC